MTIGWDFGKDNDDDGAAAAAAADYTLSTSSTKAALGALSRLDENEHVLLSAAHRRHWFGVVVVDDGRLDCYLYGLQSTTLMAHFGSASLARSVNRWPYEADYYCYYYY